MTELELAAPAKINWRLAITGRRADGYHDLMGLMQSVSLEDTVTLRISDTDSCYMQPALPGDIKDNLALRAWLLLKQTLNLRQCLAINIKKRIPVGGGLGGGSADAAAVLKGANMLLGLNLKQNELCALGLRLGADVPFCIWGGLAQAAGVGERLTPMPVAQSLNLLLVNPGFGVPTAQVFAHFKNSGRPFSSIKQEEQACIKLSAALAEGDIEACNKLLYNDLAFSAKELFPQINKLEQDIRFLGLQPLLSGSGATMFALLPQNADTQSWQSALSNWPWCVVTHTLIS